MKTLTKKIVVDIAGNLLNAKTCLLCVHESPDGDAVGSMLALGGILSGMDKEVVMFSSDVIPMRLRILPQWRNITNDFSSISGRHFDSMIMLDCGDRTRSGDEITAFTGYTTLVNIDHHASNDAFGDLNFVDLSSSCTGEEVYLVIRELADRIGMEQIPDDIATNLLAALYDDTGGMRYISTTSRTLRIAADLVDSGANCSYISEHLFFSVSRQKMELTSRVIPTLSFENNGKISYVVMRLKDLEATGAFSEDSEGLIDFPRSIQGVEVAFIIKEIEENKKFKLSFRSRGRIDVNEFCSRYGGGGHKVAAGCTLHGDFEQVRDLVLTELRKML
ncbi:MAG: bifunctional oligoribonuclease/PAP phosphatase NrnA [Oligoflexia bacterium]|nr:bifunctional oligoribonuclease/PAP phosphatase NrnA [Oligoflexia bacterium]